MHIFKIDAENRVTASVTKPMHILAGEHIFADPKAFGRLVTKWPAARLVDIWNKLPGAKRVSRFTDRKSAIRRIWDALQALQPSLPEKPARSTKDPAKTNPFGARDGTKSARVIALLNRPSGATLKDLMEETDWQAHSVRGFISGQLSRRLGLRVTSSKQGGERIYRIVKGEVA